MHHVEVRKHARLKRRGVVVLGVLRRGEELASRLLPRPITSLTTLQFGDHPPISSPLNPAVSQGPRSANLHSGIPLTHTSSTLTPSSTVAMISRGYVDTSASTSSNSLHFSSSSGVSAVETGLQSLVETSITPVDPLFARQETLYTPGWCTDAYGNIFPVTVVSSSAVPMTNYIPYSAPFTHPKTSANQHIPSLPQPVTPHTPLLYSNQPI